MLQFFRRYQKIFFLFVTTAIVISFTFFGAYTKMNGVQEVPDKVVGKGVNGTPLMQRDLEALSHFIATSLLDRAGWHQGKIPNLLNDSVIQKDLMATGMGMMLAERYFEELKADLEERMVRVKHFRPYAHPSAPHLNAEAVWRRFHPSLMQHLSALKMKTDQCTPQTLGLMFQLYLDQAQLPPEMLKRILSYQQNQQGIPVDPALEHADLSLFGFQTLEEWFGPRLIALASQFILNAALVAEDAGYKIGNEEVRTDLFQNIAQGCKEVSPQEKIGSEEVAKYYRLGIQHLGMDEPTVRNAWRRVMLFRRLFNDVGGSVFVDALPFKQFQAFAKDSVKVDLYELPPHLQMKDLRSLCCLQIYLDAVSRTRNPGLKLPVSFASVEEIEKRAPELVEERYEIEYREVNTDELAARMSLKETWDWEVGDSHWEELRKQFPEVPAAHSLQERLSALDHLDGKLRLKIDQFARVRMVETQPELIVRALEEGTSHLFNQGVRSKGGALPFADEKSRARFLALLREDPLADELNRWTCDGKRFYKINVLKRDPQKKGLTFAEALQDGTLDQMLDRQLKSAYPDVRRKDHALFQEKDGSWKPFAAVKDSLARFVYADLFKSIEKAYAQEFGALPLKSSELPSAFYTQHGLFPFVKQASEVIQVTGDDPALVQEKEEGAFEKQWYLLKSTRAIERSSALSFSKEKMFALPSHTWSAVEIGHAGALAFFHVLGKEKTPASLLEGIDQTHQALSIDARRSLMIDLLNQIADKKAICL